MKSNTCMKNLEKHIALKVEIGKKVLINIRQSL